MNWKNNFETSKEITLYLLSSFLARATLGLMAWAVVITAATTQASNSFHNHSNSSIDYVWIAFFLA